MNRMTRIERKKKDTETLWDVSFRSGIIARKSAFKIKITIIQLITLSIATSTT